MKIKTILLTITFTLVCLLSKAEPYEVQKEVRVEQSQSCSLEEFSSRENAEKYIAQNGGELIRDQDTRLYRVVKCNFNIDDRVLIVSNMNEDDSDNQSTALLSGN